MRSLRELASAARQTVQIALPLSTAEPARMDTLWFWTTAGNLLGFARHAISLVELAMVRVRTAYCVQPAMNRKTRTVGSVSLRGAWSLSLLSMLFFHSFWQFTDN